MSKMPGYVRAELLREQNVVNRYQMLIRFQSAEESDAWRSSPEHKSLSTKLKAFYKDSKVVTFKVVM